MFELDHVYPAPRAASTARAAASHAAAAAVDARPASNARVARRCLGLDPVHDRSYPSLPGVFQHHLSPLRS